MKTKIYRAKGEHYVSAVGSDYEFKCRCCGNVWSQPKYYTNLKCPKCNADMEVRE